MPSCCQNVRTTSATVGNATFADLQVVVIVAAFLDEPQEGMLVSWERSLARPSRRVIPKTAGSAATSATATGRRIVSECACPLHWNGSHMQRLMIELWT
mmetsp:Transcript_47576/g.89129  ORF Transcript_47576/g.89129 Transcript_47576/m.89129 type:complete len:99 (+) Transcript_47576:666-962(+)